MIHRRMDKLMNLYIKQKPDFINAYTTTNTIINRGSRRSPGNWVDAKAEAGTL